MKKEKDTVRREDDSPSPLELLREHAEKKRTEFIQAIEARKVRGPLAFAVPYIIPALIGTGISFVTSAAINALMPARKITTGSLAGFDASAERGEDVSQVE